MKISILTLFPEMFDGPFSHSIVKRAIDNKYLTIQLVNIRDFGIGLHKMVDDTPYGGGKGMVMRPDVVSDAINATRDNTFTGSTEEVVLLDARGETFTQTHAKSFSQLEHLILLCGHYEGVDERIRSQVDRTISLGDFIVTGGETPAMVIADAVARLVPGVLSEEATENESFSTPSLEHPHYTKPREYNGQKVPDVLLSGNHAEIAAWRKTQSTHITTKHRPDLIKK